MLNRKEILIKLIQILDFDMNDTNLKQSAEKKRFVTFEESPKKTKEHIELIFELLNLDEVDEKFKDVFEDLIYLYEQIESKLLFRLDKAYEKKLNWIILKRLVIPYLAYRFANMDVEYDTRIDKGMSGGKFWYLPDVADSQQVKMPIEYIMRWWLDLYGKGLDSLCNEIDTNYTDDKHLSSKDTLNPWLYKDKLPSRVSLELYLNKQIIYRGCFKAEDNSKVSIEFEKAKEFVIQKKLTSEALKDEIPEYTLIDKIFTAKEAILKREKQYFISLIAERWAKPTKKSLITKFLIARAVQDSYKKLMDYFGIKKDSVDIEENKILQLIHEYQVLYNNEMTNHSNLSLTPMEKQFSYELMGAFRHNNFKNIIMTISSDINIELESPLVENIELENIYSIISSVAFQNSDMKLAQKSIEELREFTKYFHSTHDDYEMEIAKYQNLNNDDFILELRKENNFKLLSFLFYSYQSTEYTKVEKICFRMSELAKTSDEDLQVLSLFLERYTDIQINENVNQYMTTKYLISKYLDLLKKNEISKEISSKHLIFQISFYFKSREFKKTLKFCDKYFDEFIDTKKKEEIHTAIAFLSAYCAYSIGDDKKLKKYNKFLKKLDCMEFENQKSLIFPIYFYK